MPQEIPLFPLNTVLFPGMPLPLHIFELRYREMIGMCSEEKLPFGVVLIKDGIEVGEPATPFEVGTLAEIVGLERFDDGRMNAVTVGKQRFRLLNHDAQKKSYMVGTVDLIDDEGGTVQEVLPGTALPGVVQRYVTMMQAAAEQELTPIELPHQAAELSYLIGGLLKIGNRERQQLLEAGSVAERLHLEEAILDRETKNIEAFLQQRKSGLGPFSRN